MASRNHVRRVLGAAVSIVATTAGDCLAAFPGDNGDIAFTRYAFGNLAGVVAVAPPVEDAMVDERTEGGLSALPAWSPDGSRIAFYSTRDGNPEIYVMDADGSDVQRLTDNPAFDYVPAWSPDGSMIVFASNRDGDFELFALEVAGGGQPIQLTFNEAEDNVPAWSPGCQRIAFSSLRDGNYEIYVMNADGSEQTRLTESPGIDLYPDWSPDGEQIVFASDREGTMGRDIWIMDADGGNQRSLVERAENDSDPAFSPDGQLVAFSGDSGASGQIRIAAADDGELLVHVTDPTTVDDRAPDWQPIVKSLPAVTCPDLSPTTTSTTTTTSSTTTLPVSICGDANADGQIKATDALVILKAAVGNPIECIPPRCDADSSGTLVASDALRVLRYAVGQSVVLNCPPA